MVSPHQEIRHTLHTYGKVKSLFSKQQLLFFRSLSSNKKNVRIETVLWTCYQDIYNIVYIQNNKTKLQQRQLKHCLMTIEIFCKVVITNFNTYTYIKNVKIKT